MSRKLDVSADSPSQGSKSAKKRKRDPIWESFTEVEENGEIKMECSQCHEKFSKYKTVLMRHWEKKHQDKDQPRKQIRSTGAKDSIEPKEKYKKIQKALSAVLSIPSLPIHIFMHPLVRKLFQVMSPSFELPKSFASFKRILQEQFLSLQEDIKDNLSKMQQRYSLTCDVWTDSGMKNAYLGVTLHYADVTGTLRRIFLGFQQLNDSHTGALVRRETEKILCNYGLSLTNAFKVVTDAGSNMVKAFNEIRMSDIDPNQYEVEFLLRSAFPLRLGCFAHALQLVIMQIFKEYWQNWQFKLADCQNWQFKLVTGKTGKLALVVGKTGKAGSDTGTGTFTTASLAASASFASLATTSVRYQCQL
uniref:BED-type domain-containing protein n=1 Tax=Ditylenchus dipsaci TaxID=166011 RepID=A0A915DJ64_9BILA